MKPDTEVRLRMAIAELNELFGDLQDELGSTNRIPIWVADARLLLERALKKYEDRARRTA